MENNYQLMVQSDAKGYNVYSGISRLLMAYTLQITVDCWGKIPYSQALQGAAKLQPAYDNDNGLYSTIQSLCDTAIILLNNPSTGVLVPGGEDVIYNGKASSWIKFAHALKARLYIHQSKASNPAAAGNASKALTEIASSFTGNTDNAFYTFGSTANSAGPWYQFNTQRGDISFATSTLATNLLANNDPRFPLLIDTTAANGGDYLGGYYGNINGVVELITYDELQFITAEATIVSGGTVAAAQTAYQAGITANMQKLGVDATSIATYVAANGIITSGNAMQKIGYEVNVALYLNPEAWVTWRRTGYPALVSNKTGTNIPRRLLYPQTEYSYNAANTPASTMYTPLIFWDN
jgi:hypothetical protein